VLVLGLLGFGGSRSFELVLILGLLVMQIARRRRRGAGRGSFGGGVGPFGGPGSF